MALPHPCAAPAHPRGGNIPQGLNGMDYMTEASQNFMQKPTSYDPREREEMKRRMQAANFSFGDEKPAMQSSTGSTFLAVPVAPPSEEEQRQQRERREGARSACSQTLFAPPLLWSSRVFTAWGSPYRPAQATLCVWTRRDGVQHVQCPAGPPRRGRARGACRHRRPPQGALRTW